MLKTGWLARGALRKDLDGDLGIEANPRNRKIGKIEKRKKTGETPTKTEKCDSLAEMAKFRKSEKRRCGNCSKPGVGKRRLPTNNLGVEGDPRIGD